jgi:hypothetical protein
MQPQMMAAHCDESANAAFRATVLTDEFCRTLTSAKASGFQLFPASKKLGGLLKEVRLACFSALLLLQSTG